MIYTVTCNPSLDYIVTVNDFQLGQTNRTTSEQMLPGGKGINVSTVLKNLGVENTALGFVAGFTGREIVRKVRELGFQNEFLELSEGWSRINIKMKDFDGTEINGKGPEISEEAVQALLDRLDQVEEGDVLGGEYPGEYAVHVLCGDSKPDAGERNSDCGGRNK